MVPSDELPNYSDITIECMLGEQNRPRSDMCHFRMESESLLEGHNARGDPPGTRWVNSS